MHFLCQNTKVCKILLGIFFSNPILSVYAPESYPSEPVDSARAAIRVDT